MGVLLDWTISGPLDRLSWLSIIFALSITITLSVTLVELLDSWKTYKAVILAGLNGRYEILAKSSLKRSIGRTSIQLVFLAFLSTRIISSIHNPVEGAYWYRVLFISTFIIVEILLILLVINDIIARSKLEDMSIEEIERVRNGP